MIHHAGAATAGYAYDSRDRCTQVTKDGSVLADYTWLGSALARRDTTCDYPGGTKPKFKSDFQRDGLLRVTKLVNEHLTLDQAGSTWGDLGTWDYAYDTAGNALSAIQATTTGINLRVDNWYAYDTANRLITSQYDDHLSGWNVSSTVTSTYQYDDLGNRQSHDYRYGVSPSPIAYGHDKANRMTQIAGLTQGYDLAGNVTLAYSADRGTSYVYKYDHHNRLVGVYDSTGVTRKAAFGWDALGRRIEFWRTWE